MIHHGSLSSDRPDESKHPKIRAACHNAAPHPPVVRTDLEALLSDQPRQDSPEHFNLMKLRVSNGASTGHQELTIGCYGPQ